MTEQETKKLLELMELMNKFINNGIGWSDFFAKINSIVDKKKECNLQHYLQELIDEPQIMEDTFEDAELYTAMLNIFQKYAPNEPLTYRHMLTWMAADYKEPKYKLNILEYLLLDQMEAEYHPNLLFGSCKNLMAAKKRGYYKDITPDTMLGDIMNNYEVVE